MRSFNPYTQVSPPNFTKRPQHVPGQEPPTGSVSRHFALPATPNRGSIETVVESDVLLDDFGEQVLTFFRTLLIKSKTDDCCLKPRCRMIREVYHQTGSFLC